MMNKVKEFFKGIKYKELLKTVVLSVVVVYVIMSVSYAVYEVANFRSMSDLSMIQIINDKTESNIENNSHFEEILREIEEKIESEKEMYKEELEQYNGDINSDPIDYYGVKYPHAMHEIIILGLKTGDLYNILVKSVLSGIIVGLSIYFFKNTTKVSKLLIKYAIMYIFVLLVNNGIPLLPGINIVLGNGAMMGSSLGSGVGDDDLIIVFYVSIIALTIIKVLKNISVVNKLNNLVKSKKDE